MRFPTFVLSLLFPILFPALSLCQSFTSTQISQGYAALEQTITFIFDENLYQVVPNTVVITGEFRNWDQNMEDPDWLLHKSGELWLLTIDNTDFSIISPQSTFKFRINDGEWMEPPANAPNIKGSDLIFMKEMTIPTLTAEIRNERLIWARVSQGRPLSPAAYRLTDASGNEIPITAVLPNDATSILISPSQPLNKKRVYFLEIPSLNLGAHCSFDGWFRETYSHKELGANIYRDTTTIRIFSPRADSVKLYLYQEAADEEAYKITEMVQDQDGVWEMVIPENLYGVYYDFTVHGANDPGNHFYQTIPVHITDPYARVSDDTWGKARIWHKTTPASPLEQGIPAMEDVIAYEVHVQDFTDLLPVDSALKGTFKAMMTPGLRNKKKKKVGFDYLVELGINVLHLMPVQEYVHYPDDDWQASFSEDPYMVSQGVSEENYQWGYRTSHAFAVESRYRTKGSKLGTEREEFRDLVQAFHDQGIAVIIDIVPNHTAENMDGNEWFFHFNVLDKLYYYRTKNFNHIGAYGNEVKTENRPMVQRWLIDQCLHYIHEFGIDGFRIDLAGQIDEQTLIALKTAIGEDKILYGEAWIGSNDPAYENNPDWDWYKADAPITFFQDDSRNAYKGPVFELHNKETDRGWPGGKFDEREKVMKGLTNTFPEEKSPLSGISYLDIHDNFALADQFGTVDFDGRYEVDESVYKIAVALLYTSLGPIVMHGGSEIMRSKASAPLGEVVKETQAGYKIYMHGYRDTYNHRKANQFLWETVGQRPNKKNNNDYRNMYAFWKGMNAFRLSEFGKVFRVAEAVPEDYYQFLSPSDESMLGYIVDDKVWVLLNPSQEEKTFEQISLPPGHWHLIANTKEIDHMNGVKDEKELIQIEGGGVVDIRMEPTSLFIWINKE